MEQLGIGSAKQMLMTAAVVIVIMYIVMHVDALREFIGFAPPVAA